jgi:predicted ATPase
MITRLDVRGFRSLVDFSIRFTSGLNVLIGPNGAGKSNICHSLGLLSAVAEGAMAPYVLSLGGAGSLFTFSGGKWKRRTSVQKLTVLCQGDTSAEFENEQFNLQYKYSFSIERTKDSVGISDENLEIRRRSDDGSYSDILRARRKAGGAGVSVGIRDQERVGPVSIDRITTERGFELKTEHAPPDSFMPILAELIFVCFVVRRDLTNLRAWNIDPHIARRSSDILEPSAMRPDGRGLTNAIHSVVEERGERLADLNAVLAGVIPRYKTLKAGLAGDELTRSFSVAHTDGVVCPAHSLSDGAVKMIALLVGIFTGRADSAVIEEPENYLHPWACQWITAYLRDYFADGACILTTHSETVLNSTLPSEIVIVENESGSTEVSRLSSRQELVGAIERSGFGCGYHYIAGSLGGVPR